MFDANDSGAGIAWRMGEYVHWKKGLEIAEIQDLCATVPLPYVAHFRIPSCGGSVLELCHPFPIEKSALLDLEGKIKGHVLFHNGHWNDWKKDTKDAALLGGIKLPTGRWSDSRAMAFLAAHFGLGILEMIDEKIVAFGLKEVEVFGFGWNKVNDVWVSNKGWESSTIFHRGNYHNRGNAYHTTPPASIPGGKEEKKGSKETAIILGPVAQSGSGKAEGGPGGGSNETPFEVALRLFTAGKISKKSFKKVRRCWEQECREAKAKMITH